MRKYLAALLFCLPMSASAQTKAGTNLLGFNIGAGLPLTKDSSMDERIGKNGVLWGARWVHHTLPRVALGADFAYSSYDTNHYARVGFSDDSQPKTWMALGIVKVLTNSEQRLRGYGLGGIGMNGFTWNLSRTPAPGYTWTDTHTNETRTSEQSSTGVAFAFGGGLEADIGDNATGGLEVRWNRMAISKEKFGGSSFNTMSITFQLAYKFDP